MNGMKWQVDSSMFILKQETNFQQPKWVGISSKQTKRDSSNHMWLRSGTQDALGARILHEFKSGQDKFLEQEHMKG